MKTAKLLLALVLAFVTAATAQSALDSYTPVTDEMLAEPSPNDWLMFRRTLNEWAHSPLDQINRENVDSLRLAWSWTLDPARNEMTPLIHDGVMFLVQGNDYVQAVDATDGTLFWEYRREVVDHVAPLASANRNGVLYEDKLIIATHDAYLVALDVHTGQVVWEQQVGDWTIGHHYSGGPVVINGKVVQGMSGCYYYNTGCWISAHDADTGEELWRTNTIPAVGEPGGETWGDVPNESRRGGSAWNAPSYDPELNLIYYGVAVPIPWGSAQRGTGNADVLYSNSTIALNADTGELVWYFQYHPNEEWDLDHPFERLIVETEVSPSADEVQWINPDITPGETRKVITGIPGKTGIVWTLDAATGEFLWARETNPQNVLIDVDIENHKGVNNPDIQQPEIGEQIFVCPYLLGGRNWNQAVTYDPALNILYTATNDTCMNFSLNPVQPTLGAHHGSARSSAQHVPDSDEQVGRLSAINVATGETVWNMRQRAGIGGALLSTDGGLVFVTDDARRFRAFDSATGEILWEQLLNSSAGGFPVTYMVDGVQYIAIAAGGGVSYRNLTPEIRQPSGGNVLYVFRLP